MSNNDEFDERVKENMRRISGEIKNSILIYGGMSLFVSDEAEELLTFRLPSEINKIVVTTEVPAGSGGFERPMQIPKLSHGPRAARKTYAIPRRSNVGSTKQKAQRLARKQTRKHRK